MSAQSVTVPGGTSRFRLQENPKESKLMVLIHIAFPRG